MKKFIAENWDLLLANALKTIGIIMMVFCTAWLVIILAGCGMTPAQKNAVKALDNNADFFVKHVKPTAIQPVKDVIDANKALTKEMLDSSKNE